MTRSTTRQLHMTRRYWNGSTALTAVMLLMPSAVLALPVGGVNVDGTAVISSAGLTTTVDQSTARAVINWDSFNVDTAETVRFQQPSVSAITLNRVTADANPSQILGKIEANGRVVISNPNGMVFGPNSRTDVAGLIATTADISNSNFMNSDSLNFNVAGTPNAKIEIKEGARITSTLQEQGLVAIVAPQVVNRGIVMANAGTVVLAGAEKATLDLTGDGLVSFTVDNSASNTMVHQAGQINAQSGRVFLTAKAASDVVEAVVNNNGIPDADALVAGPNGLVLVEGNIDVSQNENATKPGKIEVKGRDIIARNGAELKATGTQGGSIYVGATRHALIANANLKSNASGEKHKGGAITVLAEQGVAALGENSSLEANGYNGGKISFSGKDILLAGLLSAGSDGGRNGTVTIDPATIFINDGASNGLLNNIAEQWIEAQSVSGADVTIEATNLIRMENLADNVLLGGAGNITLRATGATGAVTFDSNGDYIRTTSGDVSLFAGSGGIQIGNIATGIDGAYPAFDAPTGDVNAGNIRLATTNGGNIIARNLVARGTKDNTSILVDSAGGFTARSLAARVDDQPAPGSADTARVAVNAVGTIDVSESVTAHGRDVQGGTRNGRASIALISTDGDVNVGGQVFANADGGLETPADAGESIADIRISGKNLDLHRVNADADGGHDSTATVLLTADNLLTVRNDVLATAKKSADGLGVAVGNLTMNALQVIVPITDASGVLRATNDVTINAPISVNIPEDATLLAGSNLPLFSDRALKLRGGNSVTVTGDISSLLANIIVEGGAGGITLANVSTGDEPRVNSYVLNQPEGPFKAGNITLSTSNGGDVLVGDLNNAGTLGTTTISANSSGNLTTGNIRIVEKDIPDRGSVGLLSVVLTAVNDLLINGNVNMISEDRQGGSHDALATFSASAGQNLSVNGDVSVLAQGGFRGKKVGDTGSSFASANFTAGNDLTLQNVTIEALGGTDAVSSLFIGAPNGTLSLGDAVARAITTTVSEAGNPVVGTADASLELVALGTAADSDANITYNGADPIAEANNAFRQGRLTDVETIGGNTARLTIINPAGIPPVVPPVPPVAPAPAISALNSIFTLVEIELNRTSDFAQNLYSYFGETVGDQYYFGNTNVNLSLLGGNTQRQASFSNDPSALAGLSPAAGGGATGESEQQRKAPRLTGGSEGKRARYAWSNNGGQGFAASQTAAVSTATTGSADALANLSPAAGGNNASALSELAPAAGESGSCGNNYLDAGYTPGFDGTNCRVGGAF